MVLFELSMPISTVKKENEHQTKMTAATLHGHKDNSETLAASHVLPENSPHQRSARHINPDAPGPKKLLLILINSYQRRLTHSSDKCTGRTALHARHDPSMHRPRKKVSSPGRFLRHHNLSHAKKADYAGHLTGRGSTGLQYEGKGGCD